MRTIVVVTGSRADYGIYLPILREIEQEAELALRLLVCGAHLSTRFGRTVTAIETDGIAVAERIETLCATDMPEDIGRSIARGVNGFTRSFAKNRPDILLLLGDRTEMLAAATAALPFNIPIAHIHGGEASGGAIDEVIRHAVTKMSHLHFVATDAYGARVIQMGESPDRVFVTGAPGLDSLRTTPLVPEAELERRLETRLDRAPLLVTFHPVTREYEDTPYHIAELLASLEAAGCPIIFTYPNADTWSCVIIEAIDAYVNGRPDARAVPSLGSQDYHSLMACAAAMVGNSSSGIIEAASFGLPVVNIGTRQDGRLRARNVIDSGYGRAAIADALRRALDPAFRASLQGLVNPFGDGKASARIVDVLRDIPLGRVLVAKSFYDLPAGESRLWVGSGRKRVG